MGTLHQAPKREVLEIWRTGTYGQSTWHHRLECGHVAQKKRKSPAKSVACPACGGVEPNKGYTIYDPEVARITMEQRVVAGLALRYGVQPEMIDVRIEMDGDTPYPALALVTLTREDLKDI